MNQDNEWGLMPPEVFCQCPDSNDCEIVKEPGDLGLVAVLVFNFEPGCHKAMAVACPWRECYVSGAVATALIKPVPTRPVKDFRADCNTAWKEASSLPSYKQTRKEEDTAINLSKGKLLFSEITLVNVTVEW